MPIECVAEVICHSFHFQSECTTRPALRHSPPFFTCHSSLGPSAPPKNIKSAHPLQISSFLIPTLQVQRPSEERSTAILMRAVMLTATLRTWGGISGVKARTDREFVGKFTAPKLRQSALDIVCQRRLDLRRHDSFGLRIKLTCRAHELDAVWSSSALWSTRAPPI